MHALTLIVMTRLPREGRNKTRLIPALGANGAMEFHDRLARHAIGRASSFCMMGNGRGLRVCIEGGTPIDGKSWLGDDGLDCREQSPGDLGARMLIAAEEAFTGGTEKVIIIGTDCPGIDESVLSGVEEMLNSSDLVFGPALDGGYYLIGMTKPFPEIFQGIPWGGTNVLTESLRAAEMIGIRTAISAALPDVDLPEDLPAAEEALGKGATVSVIIPVFNEEASVAETLNSIFRSFPHEVIVVDGGSTDRTFEIAKAFGVQVITAARGRALQMNKGAELASGEFLLFLHADTLPPKKFPVITAAILRRPGTSAGAFRFRLGGNLGASELIEALVSLRCSVLGTPYGDQGIFARRSIFTHLGGFPNSPVMEDLHFIRRAAGIGKIRMADEAAITSPRRWEKGGLIRTFLRHQAILLMARLGIPEDFISALAAGGGKHQTERE